MPSDQEAGAAPVPKKVPVMPEAFSAGDSEDWHSWLKYFRNCAALNAWNDEQGGISWLSGCVALRNRRTQTWKRLYKKELSPGYVKLSAVGKCTKPTQGGDQLARNLASTP